VGFPSLENSDEEGNSSSGIEEINRLQKSVWEVHIDQSLQDYIIQLVGKTRSHPDLALGASPRASLALYKASQAYASINGRDYVIPDDIKTLIPFVLPHRLILRPEAELRGRTALSVISELLENTPLELGTNSLKTS